jgi:hypothetical protein
VHFEKISTWEGKPSASTQQNLIQPQILSPTHYDDVQQHMIQDQPLDRPAMQQEPEFQPEFEAPLQEE